jgi:hypothetical protein
MDTAVLDLLKFWQRELRETTDGAEALEKLHVRSPETADHFQLGYASGRALAATSQEQAETLKALGLVRRGRERFQGGVVVPVFDEDGALVDLHGLRPWESGLRFVFWQKPVRGLIGVSALRAHPEIVLTDNAFHALHVRQHGYPNVVALRHPGELKQHLGAFERYGVERVYLVSRQHRKPIAARLESVGVEVVCLGFPKDALVVPKESLAVIGQAPREKRRAPPEVTLVARDDRRLHFSAGGMDYRVELVAASGLSMRVMVRAEREGQAFIDKVDLGTSDARRKFARLCGMKLGAAGSEIEDQLAAIASAIDELETEAAAAQVARPRELTESERASALKVLEHRDVLSHLADAVERQFGFIAEPENRRLTILVAASRLLDRPLGAIIRGPAGSGKSALMQAVLKTLPPSQTLNLSRLTPQALYFMPRDALLHRLLIVDEYEGLSNCEYALRTVMSSQTLSLAITVREGGRLPVTRTVEIPATLAVLVSTTGAVNIENLSRFIELRMDASSGQTERVMRALAAGSSDNRQKAEATARAVQDVCQLLRPCTVRVPFAGKLTYSARSVLARRQFAQVVGLISAHAVLMQYQRKTEQTGETLVVEADKADYVAVHPLLTHVVEHFEEHVSPPGMELLECIERMHATTFTRREVMRWTGWSYSKTHRTLSELSGLDLLIRDSTTNGVQCTYEAAPYFRSDRGISQIAPPSAL